MDRFIDLPIVVAGIVAAGIGLLIAETGEGRFNALFIVLAVVLSGVTLNHTIPRRPRLVVRYRNPEANDRPVVWPRSSGQPHARLLVVVENQGRGAAESVEVRFAKLGATIWNETGNYAPDVDDAVSPPRFSGGSRVLGPGETWTVATLTDSYPTDWQGGPAQWLARARNMVEQHGTVEVELLAGPPS